MLKVCVKSTAAILFFFTMATKLIKNWVSLNFSQKVLHVEKCR